MKQAGLPIAQLSSQELAKLRDKMKPVVDKYTKEVGEPLVKHVYDEIQKARSR